MLLWVKGTHTAASRQVVEHVTLVRTASYAPFQLPIRSTFVGRATHAVPETRNGRQSIKFTPNWKKWKILMHTTHATNDGKSCTRTASTQSTVVISSLKDTCCACARPLSFSLSLRSHWQNVMEKHFHSVLCVSSAVRRRKNCIQTPHIQQTSRDGKSMVLFVSRCKTSEHLSRLWF